MFLVRILILLLISLKLSEASSISFSSVVVASSTVVVSEDMKDVQRALVKRMDEDNKAKQLEIDRKNMRDYDIRAVEFLKQQCNVR